MAVINGTGLFTAFSPNTPATRSFELIEFMPAVLVEADVTNDLKKFISICQDCVEVMLAEIDDFTDIFDVDLASEQYLDAILFDLGNPFLFDLTELDKRRLARILVPLYRQKGTEPGVQNAIRFFLGIEVVDIVEHLDDCIILGVSELGVSWVLCPGDSFDRFSFDIIVSTVLTQSQRDAIRTIVDYMKPAHTHFVNLIEPGSPLFVDHWELGISELGTESELHA